MKPFSFNITTVNSYFHHCVDPTVVSAEGIANPSPSTHLVALSADIFTSLAPVAVTTEPCSVLSCLCSLLL